MRHLVVLAAASILAPLSAPAAPPSALVFMTDFGVKDGAVSAMKGVAFGVDPGVHSYDLTHEIPPYSIWQGAYRLSQAAPYWPAGSVFVTVVDPGVGTERKSVVVRSKTGHYFVGPDNGLFTLVAEKMGIAAVRDIDESKQRLKGSEASHTFHGRDIFAYVGARLATGKLKFEDVGPARAAEVFRLPHEKPRLEKDGALIGGVPVLDLQYGNVWSDIGKDLFDSLKPKYGDVFLVKISQDGKPVCEIEAPFVKSFGDVPEGKPMIFINSQLEVALAINMGNFAEAHKIAGGPEWSLQLRRKP